MSWLMGFFGRGTLLVAAVLLGAALPAGAAAPPAINGVTALPGSPARYEKFELTVDLATASILPYNPIPAEGGVDLWAEFTRAGQTTRVNGFHDGSSWRIRFAAREAGAWSWVVRGQDAGGSARFPAAGSADFTVRPSAHHGWLRVSGTDGRFLRHDDGTSFLGVGHNNGWQGYRGDVESFAKMASKGENVFGLWLSRPWEAGTAFAPIENAAQGIGVYNQASCQRIDGVLDAAEAAGIQVFLSIWPHDALRAPGTGHPAGWSDGNWSNSAYSALGFGCDEFYTNAASKAWQRKFYRYLIARYGHSRALGAWIPVVEMNGTNGYVADPAGAVAWLEEFQDFFDAGDPFDHPTAVGKSGDAAFPEAWAITDLCDMHCYTDLASPSNIPVKIANQTKSMHDLTPGKPAHHGEFGTNDASLQPRHLHNAIWGALTEGAALTPLLWCDGGSWTFMTDPMFDQMRWIRRFADEIDFPAGGFVRTSVTVSNGWGRGMGGPTLCYGWVRRPTANIDGQTLTFNTGQAGITWRVYYYHPWTGAILAIRSIVANAAGQVMDVVPAVGERDVAVRLEKSGTSHRILSGRVTGEDGSGLGGVRMALSGTASGEVFTDDAGRWRFSGLADGSYTVTPSLDDFNFAPFDRSTTLSGLSGFDLDFIGSEAAPPPPPPPGLVLIARVNFQPAGAPVPPDYLKAGSEVFGDRGNGFSYGWIASNPNVFDRNDALSPDQRHDTLARLHKSGISYTWEFALPAGSYTVHVVSGDPTYPTGYYQVAVEGVLAVDGAPSTANRWLEGAVTVPVNDGRMTFSNGPASSGTRICFLEIWQEDDSPPPPPPPPPRTRRRRFFRPLRLRPCPC